MSGTGSHRPHPASGFTLLELLVVLAIMLMMAAAFPVVLDRALPGRRVMIATARLAMAIRDAEARSITQQRPIHVRLAALTGTFAPSTHVSFTDWDGTPLSALLLYPDGSASGGRLRVVDGSRGSTLTLNSLTGNMRVEEY